MRLKSLHILITANSAWNIWHFRRPVLRALLDDGHRITVLAPFDASVADLETLGCRMLPLAMSLKGLNPFEDLALLRSFKRTFRDERPDVILSYTIKNNIFGALAASRVGLPFVPNVTGLGTAFLSSGLLQMVAEGLYRRAFRGLPVIFFQNSDDRELFLDRRLIRAEQAQLLPGSGIDLERFGVQNMPASAPPIFLMIARLLRDKGVVEFVEAARRLKGSHPQARFQLLGAIGAENRTAIGVKELEGWVAEGVVEYLGTTKDVRPAITAASCVVLPSYREGAPRTLIEAASMGRPLIATDVPGCRAVLTRDVSGFLCEARNAESLADSMLRFLKLSPAKQAAMGQAGRTLMEQNYDEAIVIRAYRNAISSLTRDMPTGDG